MLDCRDILDAIYVHLKDIYISHFYSTKVKSKTFTDNSQVKDNYTMTANTDPETETRSNTKQTSIDRSETVKETVERIDEDEIKLEMRRAFEIKLPYALASVCSDLARLDREYRYLKGYEEQAAFSEYLLDVGDDFPLCDRFVFPCVMFVCSMALIDIDEKKSDDFYDKYASAVAGIVTEIPFKNSSMIEKYPY